MSNSIFKAEAQKGFILRITTEILAGNLSKAIFQFTEEGIIIQEIDENGIIMYDVLLERRNFKNYHCKKNLYVKLNVLNLQKMFKNVKKKDAVTLSIKNEEESKLYIKIFPSKVSNNNRKEKNGITINFVDQPEEIDLPPGGYLHPKAIESSEFREVKKTSSNCKELDIKIQGSNFISFYSSAQIYDSELKIGKLNNTDEIYSTKFYASTFSNIIKLTQACSQIQFYAPTSGDRYPLRIESNVGLGTINIYIKDVDQINFEKAEKKKNEIVSSETTKKKKKRN